MGITGVAVILPPNEAIWHGDDHAAIVTDEDGSEDTARQRLMVNFAKTVLGPTFGHIDTTDAWHLWQIAEKNGFQMKIETRLPLVFDRTK